MTVILNSHTSSGIGLATDQQTSINSICVTGAIDFTWYGQTFEPFQPLTLIAQAAGTVASPGFANTAGRGCLVFINITAVTGSLTVSLQIQDPYTGNWVTVLTSAALAATGMTVLSYYPGIPAVANISASGIISRGVRVSATVATGPVTATIGLSMVV